MLKNASKLSLEELTKYIIKNFHNSTREGLNNLKLLVKNINDKDLKINPKLQYLGELFIQFESEILKHMENEELIIFPTILRYEKLLKSKNIGKINDPLFSYVEMTNNHEIFNTYLQSISDLFEGIELTTKMQKMKESFIDLKEKNVEHTNLENTIIYKKGAEFQEKIFGKQKIN